MVHECKTQPSYEMLEDEKRKIFRHFSRGTHRALVTVFMITLGSSSRFRDNGNYDEKEMMAHEAHRTT